MPRRPLTMRDAVPSDAEAIFAMWTELGAGLVPPSSVTETRSALDRVGASTTERMVVSELDGRVVGVVHLRREPMSPLHTHEVIQASFLLVLPEYRRHGYARALLDVGVTWAEEVGLDYVTALTTASSRDANRFLARLGLASAGALRIAPTTLVRAKLSPASRSGSSSRGQVLAQRRSMRHRQKVG